MKRTKLNFRLFLTGTFCILSSQFVVGQSNREAFRSQEVVKTKETKSKEIPGQNKVFNLPDNWEVLRDNSVDNRAIDSYGNPIINSPEGLPGWSAKDIEEFHNDFSRLIDLQKKLTNKKRGMTNPDVGDTELFEIKVAIGNYLGQAIIRGIDYSGHIKVNPDIDTVIAKSCADFFKYYETEKYIFSTDGLYPEGDGPFGEYGYNATQANEAYMQILSAGNFSVREIQNTGDFIRPMESKAMPSGNYYETSQSSSMSYLSGATIVFNGSNGTYDDQYSDVPIGFNFKFYECDDSDNNTSVRLSTNGYFSFFQQGGGSTDGIDYSNDVITNTTDPDGFVAPIWDDLKIYNLGSIDKLSYKTEGSVGSRVFTAEWYSISYYNTSSTGYLYAQAKLYEATGMVELLYGIYSGSDFSFTSGIEDYAGSDGDDGATGSANYYSTSNYKFQPQRPPSSVTVSGGGTACSGGGYTLSPSISGGFCSGCSWQYQWLTTGGTVVRDWSTTSTYYASPASTTSYICRVRCSCNNCNYTQSSNNTTVTIVSDPVAPSISRSPGSSPICEGTTLTITASSGTGGTGTITDQYRYYNGSWSGWSTTVPSYSAAYGVTNSIQSRRIASGNGCDDSSVQTVSWTVDQNPGAGSVSVSTGSICPGGTVTFDATGYSGTFETFEYKWNAGGSTNDWVDTDPYNWTAGNPGNSLYVRSRIGNGSCPDVYSAWSTPVAVNTESSAPTSISVTNNNTCNGTSKTLSVNGGSLGTGASWEWYSGSCGGTHVGSGSSISVNPAAGTSTNYYVRAEGNCNTTSCASATVTVSSLSTNPTSISITNNNTCNGTNKTLSVNGGTLGTGASWEWYSGSCGGTHVGSGSSISVNPAAGTSTNYYVRAEGNCNTTSCASATVTVSSLSTSPTSISVTNNNTCNGTNKTLSVNGGTLGTGASWEWYSGSCGGTHVGSGSSISVNPAAGTSTNYYVRAEGNCNTTSCASATVTVSSPSTNPTSISVTNNNTCNGTSKTLSVNGGSLGTGASWEWYSGSCGGTHVGSGSSISVDPAAGTSTNYYVRAEGNCNTTSCASATVTVSSLSTNPTSISVTNNNTCNGTSKTLSVNGGSLGTGASWEWYSGSCGGTHVGSGSSISVDPAAGTTTSYYVRAEGNCNTTSCASAMVTVSSLSTNPTSISVTNNNTCNGTNKTLSVNGGSLGTGASWEWYSGSCGSTHIGSGSSITVDPAAGTSTNYYVRAEGNCNTTSCTSTTVTVSSPSTNPTSISVTNNNTCNGTSKTLSVNGGSLGTGASWEWYSGSCGGTHVGSGSSITVDPAAGTTTSYYVRAEGDCNTSSCASTTVTVSSPSTNPTSISVTNNNTCNGTSKTLSVNGGSLGTGASWEWYSGSCGSIHVGSGSSITVDPAAGTTTNYYVRAEGTCNLSSCANGSVSVPANPGITSVTAPESSVCNNAITLLTANGVSGSGITTTWYTGANGTGTNMGTGNTISAGPGTYYARVTGTCSPAVESSITIGSIAIPSASPDFSANPVCEGSSTTLDANATAGSGSISNYAWSSGIPGNNASGSVSSSGTYTVTVTNTSGCTNTATSPSLTLYSRPTASPDFATNPICAGQSTTLDANASPGSGAITTYSWSSGISGNTASGPVSAGGSYSVTISDANGCTISAASPALSINNPATSSLVSGDYVWSGYTSSDWQTSTNWLTYNGSDFETAIAAPDNLKNVFIRSYSSCVSNSAVTNAFTDVSCKDLTVETSLTLGNGSNLNVKGDFLNSGTFSAGTGTVIFNGTSQQEITTNGNSFYNIEFDNSGISLADFILYDDISITNQLTLTNGIVDANSNSVIIEDGAGSNAGNNNSFVAGEVSRTGTTAFTYPTGDIATIGATPRGIWAPVKTDACAASTIAARYFYEAPPYDWWFHSDNMDQTIDHVTDREYWDLTTDNATPAVTVFWTDNTGDLHSFGNTAHTEMTSAFIASSMTIAHYNVSLNKWEDMGCSLPSTIYFDNGELKTTVPFTSYSPITFASKRQNFQLPVELISFSADCMQDHVAINWSTISETNNDYFLLEKSNDATNWKLLNKTEGAGNSREKLTYNVTDNNPYSGINYYRLSQFDFDGTNKTYNIISTECSLSDKKPQIIIYPNPFTNDLNIVCTNWKFTKETRLSIFDMTGKLVKAVDIEAMNQSFHKIIDLTDLESGLYILEINNPEYTRFYKVQKQ